MAGRPEAVVLVNALPALAPPHEADVLVQAQVVAAALDALGYACRRIDVSDPEELRSSLGRTRPAMAFNLVESLAGSDALAPRIPALLEELGQPFTGATSAAMSLATDKLAAKARLRAHDLRTPESWRAGCAPPVADAASWIVKSVTEHASLGLDDGAVVTGAAAAERRIGSCRARHGGEWFAERYVPGRELNVSLLAGAAGPGILPLAEIEFVAWPAGKPRVVGYRAKWEAASFESRNTVRRFVDETEEAALAAQLRASAALCWEIFGLRGYARVDFRVDDAGRAWVLDINANPCLAPDAGFAAALARAGLDFEDAIARIVADAWRPGEPA